MLPKPLKLNFVAISSVGDHPAADRFVLTQAKQLIDLERSFLPGSKVSILCLDGEEWVEAIHPVLNVKCHIMTPVNSDGRPIGCIYSTASDQWSIVVHSPGENPSCQHFNHVGHAVEALLCIEGSRLDNQLALLVELAREKNFLKAADWIGKQFDLSN